MIIIGISYGYHDSAIAFLEHGKLVAAVQEERFTRVKNDRAFPVKALSWLAERHPGSRNPDLIAYYENPDLKKERIQATRGLFPFSPTRGDMNVLNVDNPGKQEVKDFIFDNISKCGIDVRNSHLYFSEHHFSHAASAFFTSQFPSSAILTVDGVGEWDSTCFFKAADEEIEKIWSKEFPASIGLVYSAFTDFLGFKVNSGEYKVMGLAPYGNPIYRDLILENIFNVKREGDYFVNDEYFGFDDTGRSFSNKLSDLLGCEPRHPRARIGTVHTNIAASIQSALNIVMVALAKNVIDVTGEKYLCMAGGVALNCVANSHILRETRIAGLHIQPAAGDAGAALGAALRAAVANNDLKSRVDMGSCLLGPDFSAQEIKATLEKAGAVYEMLDEEYVAKYAARDVVGGKAVGWFQGGLEFGPRALGGRSIVADPRDPDMQKKLNLKIKFRESFRPFAPAVLEEHAGTWFDGCNESPYMLLTTMLKDEHRFSVAEKEKEMSGLERLKLLRSKVPAITHVDFSARVQTVSRQRNYTFWRLISYFFEMTGIPMVVNTSFNVRGEPIVCTPEDAFSCFMRTNLDVLH